MSDEQEKKPDHTLENAKVARDGEEPKVYAVVDLRAYIKPEMDEELTAQDGNAAEYGVETVCECVPVEDCVCHTVSHNAGGCECVGYSAGGPALYWYPY